VQVLQYHPFYRPSLCTKEADSEPIEPDQACFHHYLNFIIEVVVVETGSSCSPCSTSLDFEPCSTSSDSEPYFALGLAIIMDYF